MCFALPHAFARIARLELEAARAVPGVVAVFTEADLAADGIGELPCVTVIDAVEPIVVPPRPALARGVVRHVGDPVVCIIAESPEAAMAAGEAVDISYEPLPCVTAATAALQPDAPLIWPEAPGNSAFLFQQGRCGGRCRGDGVGCACRRMRSLQQPRCCRAPGDARRHRLP